VHKGLRSSLCDALARIGAAQPRSAAWSRARAHLRETLTLSEQHLVDEEHFIEPAIAARMPEHRRSRAGQTPLRCPSATRCPLASRATARTVSVRL
jgi:hypothetical protein